MAISEGKRGEGFQQPIIALACEGKTEFLHAHELAKGYRVRINGRVFKGRHGEFLVDDALAWAEENQINNPDTLIIPAALYDLEIVSNANLEKAVAAWAHAKQEGVQLFVNAPTIERWFVLCLGHKPMTAGKRVIKQELDKLLNDLRLPTYKKPGDARFHHQLALRVDDALVRCMRSGHIGNLPCMCEFIKLIRSFDPLAS